MSNTDLIVKELDNGAFEMMFGEESNPDVRWTVTPSSTVSMTVAVAMSATHVNRQTAERLRRIGLKARVDGFRPGKIPPQVLKSRYGAAARYEAIEALIDAGIKGALVSPRLENVVHVTPPAFEGQIPTEGGFGFHFTVERFPVVELPEWRGLPINVASVTVTDEEIDAEIAEIRTSHSTIEPVEDRDTVAENDVLTVSYAPVDDTLPASLRAEDEQIELVRGRVVDTFIDGLVGKKIGDTVQITLEVPASAQDERVAGKTVVLDVRIGEIRQRVLPELDDSLAQVAEKGDTLDEMRAAIRLQMETTRREESTTRGRARALQALNDLASFELPKEFVSAQAVEEFKKEIKQYFGDKDLEKMGLNLAQLAQSKVPSVEASLRAELLLLALAKAEAITVTDEDLEAWFEKRAAADKVPASRVRSRFQGEARDNLRMRLSMDKSLDLLWSAAVVTEVDPAELDAQLDASDETEASESATPESDPA